MKVSIYIESGDTQLVLTPETDWEKNVLKGIANGKQDVQIYRGSFYECRGGYFRHDSQSDESLMLRLKVRP